MASASKYPTIAAFKTLHKTGEWPKYFEESDPLVLEKDFLKIEEELAKNRRSVRKQIEKAKVFVQKFAIDLATCQVAGDASPETLASWEALKTAYQTENEASEQVQDCHDKYPNNSTVVPEMKKRIQAGINKKSDLQVLMTLLTKLIYLDVERKGLQAAADEAKANRLKAERLVTATGATLDPSYVMPTRKVPPECY